MGNQGKTGDVLPEDDVTRIVLLTVMNPHITGGAQKFMKDIQGVTGCRILNPFKHRVPDNTEFIIYFDDIVQYFRVVYPKIPYMRYYLTPRRAFYDMYYFAPIHHRILSWIVRPIDRFFVKRYIKNIACISHTVRNRINKVYQRDAKVIYSPVTPELYSKGFNGGHWLVVSRVDKWKRIDLIVNAFNNLPEENVIIVGPIYKGYQPRGIPNVRFFGEVSEEYLRRLYATCKGVICMSVDEDLGLVPLEAHASGKQVIAVREGGYTETECDILISPTVEDLTKAIKEFKYVPKYYNLTKFSYDTFYKELTTAIKEYMK